ncbi:MAG: hypothetical protein ACREU3_04415 [Steroidobacteraceae bacterium]
MPIDINQLTEAELIDLNHRIVTRLRFLQQLRTHATMLDFRIGERVSFHPEGRSPVIGMITRYNRKTVSIVTDDGHRWNVSPQLLERANGETYTATQESDNVIHLPRRCGAS